jgi:hypothetical protein
MPDKAMQRNADVFFKSTGMKVTQKHGEDLNSK